MPTMGCGGSKVDNSGLGGKNVETPESITGNTNNSNGPNDENKARPSEETKPEAQVIKANNQSKPEAKPTTSNQPTTEKDSDAKATTDSKSKSPDARPQKQITTESEGSKNLPPSSSTTPGPLKAPKVPAADNSVSPRDQQNEFDMALRLVSQLTDPKEIYERTKSDKVHTLQLQRALPPSISVFRLVSKMPHLQVLDISNNLMGPQAFRALMFAVCKNSTITALNISNNMTDTDSAESLGRLLQENQSLKFLDVSGNYLGKDYFSRCVAPAIGKNTSLQILRCESIGSTDLTAMAESLQNNATLRDLNISHNELGKHSVASLSAWLQKPSCVLKTLEMKNCSMDGDDVEHLVSGLLKNSSLQHLNVSANRAASTSQFMKFLVCCCNHANLTSLVADDIKCATKDSWKPDSSSTHSQSNLRSLSLSSCNLGDNIIASLSSCLGNSALSELREINLANNPDLTIAALKTLCGMLNADSGLSKLEKLSYGLNSTEALPSFLCSSSPPPFPQLHYLNLRKAKISPKAVGLLASSVSSGGIETLVLDGIKLAGSDAFVELLGNGQESSLKALSLSGCQLADKDLTALCRAIDDEMPLHMLKLSANRITDNGVTELVDALLCQAGHPLALIDLMNNKVTSKGAEKFCELFSSDKATSQIHSLNLNNNCIGCDGVTALMKVVSKSSLTSVQLNSQESSFDQDDMQVVFEELARTLGLTVSEEEGDIVSGCSRLPGLSAGLTVKLMGLGGEPGPLGQMLDSTAIATDFAKMRLPHLSLQHLLELAAALRGCDSAQCLMSSHEWKKVTDAEKEAPSWLQVAEHRATAIYLSHLPASVTTQKLEAVLEMEADCELQEVFLCKDMVTRKNNGYAWVLLSDTESVDRALQLMYAGQARVFGQTFLISRLNVTIDDEANSQAEAQARKDLEKRLASRRQEDVAHRSLIQQSYQESQARHAYRLAHPAYADGRIW